MLSLCHVQLIADGWRELKVPVLLRILAGFLKGTGAILNWFGVANVCDATAWNGSIIRTTSVVNLAN